jgi:hypothetical protein
LIKVTPSPLPAAFVTRLAGNKRSRKENMLRVYRVIMSVLMAKLIASLQLPE